MGSQLSATAQALTAWYRAEQRSFPWRTADPDPWLVLVSEFLLQQTQTATVAPRFNEIAEIIPTPAACAELSDTQLHRLWSGLGYYRRAENLRRAAQQIEARHQGRVPDGSDALLALSGVGPYTAGAISAIAFDRPVPGVDGNIARVYARYSGTRDTVDKLKTEAEPWLEALLKCGSPHILMQALMDIGAILCTSKKALCEACPLQTTCRAAHWTDPTTTPLPKQRRPKPTQTVVLAWIADDTHYFLEQRPEGLLGNRPAPLSLAAAEPPQRIDDSNGRAALTHQLPPYTHTFTHLIWRVRPALYRWQGTAAPAFADRTELCVPHRALADIGLPAAFAKGLPEQPQQALPFGNPS